MSTDSDLWRKRIREAHAGLIVRCDAVVAAIECRWGPLFTRHIDLLAPTPGCGDCVRVTGEQIGFDCAGVAHELQLVARFVVWKEYASNPSWTDPQGCFAPRCHALRLAAAIVPGAGPTS